MSISVQQEPKLLESLPISMVKKKKKENMKNESPEFKKFCQEVAHVTSTHIPLAMVSYMDLPNFKEL